MNKTSTILETMLPTVAGMFLAVEGATDASTIMGACVAGSGIMSLLGMLLSECIPAMKVERLVGARRMLANWLCGLIAIPFVPWLHRTYFANEDLALTAGGIAGAFALLGVSVFTIAIPRVFRVFTRTTEVAEKAVLRQWTSTQTTSKTAPTVKLEKGSGDK